MTTWVQERRYAANLEGRNEIPPVSTPGFGTADLRWVNDHKLFFRLDVSRLTRITEAHIHLGGPTENGPIVAFLYGPTAGSGGSGLSTSGFIRSSDLVGPLRGKSLKALVREMNRGNAYVNVHTSQRPEGAIRGQIVNLGKRVVASNGDAWRDGSWS